MQCVFRYRYIALFSNMHNEKSRCPVQDMPLNSKTVISKLSIPNEEVFVVKDPGEG